MIGMKSTVTKAPAGQRRVVLAQAAADRRAIVAGLVASVASLGADKALADSATPVDLFDDRSRTKKGTGFDLIYEARDLDLPQGMRDGISQYRGDLSVTKARYAETAKRIEGKLGDLISKSYWTAAREELRNQAGNFRQDIDTLVASKGSKDLRKEGNKKADDLIDACNALDGALRAKDLDQATKLYAIVKSELKTFSTFALA